MSTDLDQDRNPAIEYASHRRQYERFMHLGKWFVIHLAILMVALYCFIIAGAHLAGFALLALSIVALGYGIATTSGIARDLRAAVEHRPDPS